MPVSPSAIADLKAQWPNLHVLDRAKALRNLKQSGASNRELARQLPVGESGIRRLLMALAAPAEDRILAYDGKITTNELIRRDTAAKARVAAKQGEDLNLKRTESAIKASKIICKWLRSEGVTSNFGQQIVDEARRLLIDAEQTRQFPKGVAPPRTPLTEIIQGCRPNQLEDGGAGLTFWRAVWLSVWVYYAWPDAWVRLKAIDLALEEQLSRAGGNRP